MFLRWPPSKKTAILRLALLDEILSAAVKLTLGHMDTDVIDAPLFFFWQMCVCGQLTASEEHKQEKRNHVIFLFSPSGPAVRRSLAHEFSQRLDKALPRLCVSAGILSGSFGV